MNLGFEIRASASDRGAFYRALCLVALLLTLAACVTTPVTGRKAFNPFPIEQDKDLGGQSYAEVLKTAKVADSRPEFAMVKRVVDRLTAVADDPGNFDWEVHLIDEPKTVNAWCMPGGKMAVYTGILPVTQDETGLAVVMGHEIGHAVARHGTESLISSVGLQAVIAFIGGATAQEAAAIGSQLLSLRFSRSHELEADEIGLIYMARAGYDPDQAVAFWQRMAAQSKGAPPEWLSTHPSDERRIEELQGLMPKARKAYQKALGKPPGTKSVKSRDIGG